MDLPSPALWLKVVLEARKWISPATHGLARKGQKGWQEKEKEKRVGKKRGWQEKDKKGWQEKGNYNSSQNY